MVSQISIKDMLEAGVHFGHQTRRWNPKMRPYIFAARDGIHIIDLDKTSRLAQDACKFISDAVALGNTVLFVGTKKQAKDVIECEAERCGQYFVSNRWLGGMLTNFKTIRQSIDRLNMLTEKREKGELEKLTKKEALKIEREIGKLEFSLGGIKNMTKLPGAMFIVDPNGEGIAKSEAIKLKIPVIALTDTNSNPDGVDYIVPGNDDAIRSIQYFSQLIADSCLEGAERREAALREQQDKQEKEGPAKFKGPAIREQKIGGKGRAWVAKKEGEAASAEDAEKYAKAKVEPVAEKVEETKPVVAE